MYTNCRGCGRELDSVDQVDGLCSIDPGNDCCTDCYCWHSQHGGVAVADFASDDWSVRIDEWLQATR